MKKTYQINLIDGKSLIDVSQEEFDGIVNHKYLFPQEDLYFHKEVIGEGEDCGLKPVFSIRISQIQSIHPEEVKPTYNNEEIIAIIAPTITQIIVFITVIIICWIAFK